LVSANPARKQRLKADIQTQPDLQITPSEKIRLPLRSRDELPPILAGLQWLWMHPTLKAEIFALLEAKILAGKQATGRTGMDLWQILARGVCANLFAKYGLKPVQRRRVEGGD
jgi:transposase, IS5 family